MRMNSIRHFSSGFSSFHRKWIVEDKKVENHTETQMNLQEQQTKI